MPAKRGRPPGAEHSRAGYNRGCRCPICTAEQSRYARELKIRRNARAANQVVTLPSVAQATQPPQEGRLVAAVAEEIALLAPERANSALAALAMALAHDLATPGFGSSHAAMSRELRGVLAELAAGPRAAGKLELVSALTDRRSSPEGEPPA